ncbi:MAG: transglutaminase domain-containing protein, partial [Pirellula sp.]
MIRSRIKKLSSIFQRRSGRQTVRRAIRINNLKPSLEQLESRVLLAIDLPAEILVGRTLSAYSVSDVQNNQLKLTYSVYNQREIPIDEVRLANTLKPGVTFVAGSQPPNQNGQDLTWSLGTIPAYGRASVEITVSLAAGNILQLDEGAQVFGTVDATNITDVAPPATLRSSPINTAELASTPDANTADPVIQEKAAELNYDPVSIFAYLNDEVGYESYVGSLRGARGTLWSEAGNSLDEASLGVALFRASGIPARYAHGTLSDSLAKQLIASMFPSPIQVVGYLPANSQLADPVSNALLLLETKNHYWLQIDTGNGFQNADTSGLSGSGIGTAFATASDTFTTINDTLRHKVRISLDAEVFSQSANAFGPGLGLQTTTVLDRAWNSVDLVGRPVAVSQYVNQLNQGGLVFTSRSITYTPFIRLSDTTDPTGESDELFTGTSFQELLTNFPLSSTFLTGLNLKMTVMSPDGTMEDENRMLVDRLGFAARQGGMNATVSVDAQGSPARSVSDVVVLSVLPGKSDPRDSVQLEAKTLVQQNGVNQLTGVPFASLPTNYANLLQSFVLNQLTVLGIRNNRASDELTDVTAKLSLVRAYTDSPRLVLVSSQSVPASGNQPGALKFEIDLRRDRVRAYASPEQSKQAEIAFQTIRGQSEAVIEREILADQRLANPSQNSVNATNVFFEANRQGIPIVALTSADIQRLSAVIDASEISLARISRALNENRMVVVPSRPVTINATPTTSWFEMNIETGELIAVTESGTHGDAAEYASLYLMGSLGFAAGFGANAEFAKNPGLKEAIQAVGSTISNELWYLSYLVKLNPGIKAFQTGYEIGSGLGSVMTGVDPPAEAIFINPESNEIRFRSTQTGTIANTSSGSLRITPQSITVSAMQNTEVAIPFAVSSDRLEQYTIDALAPEGWMVKVSGQSLSIRPPAGLQSGSGEIRLTIRSLEDSTRVKSELITVNVSPTAAAINFDVAFDPILTVSYRGAELRTAFRATTQNLDPANQKVLFSYSNVTPGWEIIASRDGFLIPTGESSVHGIYLRPINGAIPSPGSSVSFTVSANPVGALIPPISRTVTVTVGNLESIGFEADPIELTAIPGSSVDGSIRLTNFGNLTTTVGLSYSPLPSNFSISSIPQSVTLAVGESLTIPYTVTSATSVSLNTEYLRFQTGGATEFSDRVTIARIRVVVPGAQSIATAAISANQLGETDLAERLNDLASAISVFVQSPSDSIARSQALSSLDAIIRLFEADPTLTQYVAQVIQARNDLAAATTSNQIRDALLILESVMISYSQLLEEEVEHGFTLGLAANVVTALPGVPARFPILLENKGSQATTFDLTVGALPFGATASFSQSSVTLQPGERLDGGPSGVTLSLSFTDNSLFPTGFTVIATPQEAISLAQQASASVAVRAEFIQVATVTPTPAFTEPGGSVAISARILNVVNREQVVLVSYRVTDKNGLTVFTSPAQSVTLNVRSSLIEVALPAFDTTAFARSDYTITVLVTDASATPFPGASGQVALLVGTPVSATLTVSPDSLLSTTSIVTNTLRLDARTVMPNPLTLLGQVQTLPTATTILVNGNIAYVAGTNGIDIVNVANPSAPQVVGTFGQGQIVQGGFTVVRALSGDRIIVATRGTLNAATFTLLTYSIANPTAPVLLGQSTIAEQFITDLFVVGNRALATTYGILFMGGNVISQFGDVLSLDLANPAAVTVSDELFGNATDDYNQNGGEVVDASTLYVASTTSTGGLQNTQLGNGVVRVIDYSNPANLSEIRDVTIPGTVQVLEIAVEGNRALVVGSTGGWKSPFLGEADAQLTGRMTLTLLDITDRRNPFVLGTTLVTESLNRPIDTADGGAKLSTLALGNGRFAISRGYVDGRPVLLLADINGDDIVVASISVPSLVNEMSFVNNTLYTTSQSGLLIYDVGTIEGSTTTVTVQVPNSNAFPNVNRVRANSFNIRPDQIISGAGSDTLVWNRPLAFGTTSSTLTWQTDISGLVPGESRDVTNGTNIAFTHAG